MKEAELLHFFIENKEVVTASLLVFAAIGLNYAQREAIRKRDNHQCQSTDDSIKCGGRLEVDHILPKEFAEQALKMTPDEYNAPENLITKCVNHHRGHPNSHHPDMHLALNEYIEGDKEAIKKAAKSHAEKARQGIIYWNNSRDGIDREIAKLRSEAMDNKHGNRKKWWRWGR